MKEFQLSEVELHNKITSCWIVINDRVYDITEYLDEHQVVNIFCFNMQERMQLKLLNK